VELIGLPWRVAAAGVDEHAWLVSDPLVAALNVAMAKARSTTAWADEIVVAADTLVVSDGEVLGKPETHDDAREMLRRLRGRAHQVLTGVALCAHAWREWGAVVSTQVVMRDFSDAEIDAYVVSGEPFDKAGGYAIQDVVFRPVDGLDGCYLNVVGLPLCAVMAGLATLGQDVATTGKPPCDYCRRGEPLVSIRSVS
jgi:MAF protein